MNFNNLGQPTFGHYGKKVKGAGAAIVHAGNRWFSNAESPIQYSGGQAAVFSSATLVLAANGMYFYPWYKACYAKIDLMEVFFNAVAGSGSAMLGIYTNTSDTFLWPKTLLWSSSAFPAAAGGWNQKQMYPNILVNPDEMYWVGVWVSAAHTTFIQQLYGATPIFGVSTTNLTSFGLGLTASSTFSGNNSFPGSFPSTANVTAQGCPFIGLRIQQDPDVHDVDYNK